MLERPDDIQDDQIATCLHEHYRLNATHIEFLPRGSDINTVVFRVKCADSSAWFIKLRRGTFERMSLLIPYRLREHVIPPHATQTDELYAELGNYQLAVFPFIDGHDGCESPLHDQHWVELGKALRALHAFRLTHPAPINYEDFGNRWRKRVWGFLQQMNEQTFTDPIAAELAAFLRDKQPIITQLLNRADKLGYAFLSQAFPFAVCHGDIHAWNVLIDEKNQLYIVDWDTLVFAPKERDLMFIGGGLFCNHRSAEEETTLFFQGYGQISIHSGALAYYRYERIIQDIAAYCEDILLNQGREADRSNGLRQLMSQFDPDQVTDIAFRSDAKHD